MTLLQNWNYPCFLSFFFLYGTKLVPSFFFLCHRVTLFTSCFLHTSVLNLSGIIQKFSLRLLEGTKMVRPPVVKRERERERLESFLYCGLNTELQVHKDRCRSNAWWETFIMTASEWVLLLEVNPQKISPYIKSTIRSYLSCCLARWKRAPVRSFSYEIPWSPHLSALSKSTLIQTGVFPWRRAVHDGEGKMSTEKQTASSPAFLWRENLTLAPVVFLHMNSAA